MSHQSDLISEDILAYLAQHERKELLRFLTCGNVDDGKSTLIGRLLHDSKMIYEDHLEAITRDSKKVGTTGEDVDLALLVDGLQAEREQGITIDVAYRYFSTAKRKFIIADTPGHEQYTRNMATGASTCDLAIILIDARYGVQTQTRRHSFIASLLGIKHIVVAINKMDLKDFDQGVFEAIKADYLQFAERIGLKPTTLEFVPMSALKGDNVVNKSERSPWYTGQSLMEILESVEIAGDRNLTDMRFPVQYVNRPNLNFRGFAGTLASGIVHKGDEVMALPSGKTSRVKSIVTYDGELERAGPGQAITLTLEDEIDDLAIHILALRQPVALDLRMIVGAIRIAADVERMADYAKNIAKRVITLQTAPALRISAALIRMGRLAQAQIRDTFDAYVARDADKAIQVRERDAELDGLYNSAFRELLTYMMEDPRSISTVAHLLFVAKNIERIGDHATNVAEFIHYTVRGHAIGGERRKTDATSTMMLTPSQDKTGPGEA